MAAATLQLRVPYFLDHLYPYPVHMRRSQTPKSDYVNPDALFLAAVVPERAINLAPEGAHWDKDRVHMYWSAATSILNDPELPSDNHKRIEAREVLVDITRLVNGWIEECRQQEESKVWGGDSGNEADEEDGDLETDSSASGDEAESVDENGAETSEQPAGMRARPAVPKLGVQSAQTSAAERAQSEQQTSEKDFSIPGAWPTNLSETQLARRGSDPTPMTIRTLLEKPAQPGASEIWEDISGAPESVQEDEPPAMSSHRGSERRKDLELFVGQHYAEPNVKSPGMNSDGAYSGLYITPIRRTRGPFFGVDKLPPLPPPKQEEPVEVSNWFKEGLRIANPDPEDEEGVAAETVPVDTRPGTPVPERSAMERQYHYTDPGWW